MLKKSLFVALFFFITPTTLIASITALYTLAKNTKPQIVKNPNIGVQIYAALPDTLPSIGSEIVAADARAEIIRQYLHSYNSPLEPHAEFIIAISDKYNLDYRLLTAIAQQESNLCKKIPEGSFNCWGWGIHSRGTLGFASFDEGIETVAAGLKKEYIDKGYTTPEEIMSKYTPLSQGSWAFGVNSFMDQLR